MLSNSIVSLYSAADYFTVDLLTDRRDWYMEGDTVTISCQLVTENNSLQWFKDGNSITNSDRFEIMRDGKLHTLFIRAVKLEDRGDYSVLVKNCRRQTIVHVEGNLLRRNKYHR